MTNNHEEMQYLQLVADILNRGTVEEGRNGITRSLFGHSMRFSLRNGTLPLLTTKRVAYKTCLRELLWFLRGETDNRILQEQNVHIWDGNSSREFLDSRQLYDYPEGILGPIYGFQWRHFGGSYDLSEKTTSEKTTTGQTTSNTEDNGVDQLQEIIRQLRHERNSRRIMLTAWNPVDLDKMALPPCHVMAQFHVRDNKYLSCALYQRSCDVGLGVPFNIASYSMMTHLLAKHCGLEAEEFVYFMGNVHIYENHVAIMSQQKDRVPVHPFPTIVMDDSVAHKPVEEWTEYDMHFVTEYTCQSALKMDMVA
jgi:thymidylate synthase